MLCFDLFSVVMRRSGPPLCSVSTSLRPCDSLQPGGLKKYMCKTNHCLSRSFMQMPPWQFKCECPHRLRNLNTGSPVSSTLWRGEMAKEKEVCHWGWTLRVHSFSLLPAHALCLCLRLNWWILRFPLEPMCAACCHLLTIIDLYPSGATAHNKFFLSQAAFGNFITAVDK